MTNAQATAEGAGFGGSIYQDYEPFDVAKIYKFLGLLFLNGLSPHPTSTDCNVVWAPHSLWKWIDREGNEQAAAMGSTVNRLSIGHDVGNISNVLCVYSNSIKMQGGRLQRTHSGRCNICWMSWTTLHQRCELQVSGWASMSRCWDFRDVVGWSYVYMMSAMMASPSPSTFVMGILSPPCWVQK